VRTPEGGFASVGLAKMFDKMTDNEAEKSKGGRAEPLTIFMAVMLAFCMSDAV
jgi:hypothetical protein